MGTRCWSTRPGSPRRRRSSSPRSSRGVCSRATRRSSWTTATGSRRSRRRSSRSRRRSAFCRSRSGPTRTCSPAWPARDARHAVHPRARRREGPFDPSRFYEAGRIGSRARDPDADAGRGDRDEPRGAVRVACRGVPLRGVREVRRGALAASTEAGGSSERIHRLMRAPDGSPEAPR